MRCARVWAVLMLSTLAGILIAGVAPAEVTTIAGQVTAVAGPVMVTRVHVDPQPLKFRDHLNWRDVVEAHKDGIARLLLGGKATVTVRELSRLELREERHADGMRYAVELMSGKVRASVARMLMRPGDQVEVRTSNAVSAVRGTDFIVETVSDRTGQAVETVVVTLSGLVDVSNRLGRTGRVERIGANQGVRVSGNQDPVRFQVSADELKMFLRGLTPPRPQQARSGDRAKAVRNKVEDLTSTVPNVRSTSGIDLSLGQGNARSAATPAIPATPATEAVPATPGVTAAIPANPAVPATSAVPARATGTGTLNAVSKSKIR